MIKQIRFILVFLVSFHALYAQISLESNNLDISIKEELLMHDTSSFHLVQIPLLSFDIDMYSKPCIFTFFETTYNSILIDLESYNHHVDDFSIHLIDIQNSLLYYAFEHRQNVYSFGLTHRFFFESSFSSELVSLIVDFSICFFEQEIKKIKTKMIKISFLKNM